MITSAPTFHVDLDRPPSERWEGIEAHAAAARELLQHHVADLGGLDAFGELLTSYADAYLSGEVRAELSNLASRLGQNDAEVLLANLYYDALKHLIGCTAFAVDTPDGPLHARNLDWGTVNRILSRHTLQTVYTRGGEVRAHVIGWPGFAGALSGVAPGRFAVTLNAVLSEDPPHVAPPLTFLLRDLLVNAPDFEHAVRRLSEEEVACDALLLVTGVRPGERVVVERSPTRAARRHPAADGTLVAANDYLSLEAQVGAGPTSILAETSCRRYDRATARLTQAPPQTPDSCFDILLDDKVRMDITVQSMVFHAASGHVHVRIPAG